MKEDKIEVKRVPLYFTKPENGTELYAWGNIRTYKMTKAKYEELFGQQKQSKNNYEIKGI